MRTVMNRAAFLCFNDWAGYRKVEVQVVGETPKRYRIANNSAASIRLAGRDRYLMPGKTALVPKGAVLFSNASDKKGGGEA